MDGKPSALEQALAAKRAKHLEAEERERLASGREAGATVEQLDSERSRLMQILEELRQAYVQVEAIHGRVKENREPLDRLFAKYRDDFTREGITAASGIAAAPQYGGYEETVEFGVSRDELRETLRGWQQTKGEAAAELGLEHADQPALISMRALEGELSERIRQLEAQAQKVWQESGEGHEAAEAIAKRHRSVEAVHRILYAPEEFVKVEPEDVAAASTIPNGDRFIPGAAKAVLDRTIDLATVNELRRLKLLDPERDVVALERSSAAKPEVEQALEQLAEQRRDLAEALATACEADVRLTRALAAAYGLADGANAQEVAERVLSKMEGAAGLVSLSDRFHDDVAKHTTATARLRMEEPEERKKVGLIPDFASYQPKVDFLRRLYAELGERPAQALVDPAAAEAAFGRAPEAAESTITLSHQTLERLSREPYPKFAAALRREVGAVRERAEQARAKVEATIELRWAQVSLSELASTEDMRTALEREGSLDRNQRQAATTLEQLPAASDALAEALDREYYRASDAQYRATRTLTYLTEASADGRLKLTSAEKQQLEELSSAAAPEPDHDAFYAAEVRRAADGSVEVGYACLEIGARYLDVERRAHELAADALRRQVGALEDSRPRVFGRGRHQRKLDDLGEVLSYEQRALGADDSPYRLFAAEHARAAEQLGQLAGSWRVGPAFAGQRVSLRDLLVEVRRSAEEGVASQLTEAERRALERRAELERSIEEASAKLERLG